MIVRSPIDALVHIAHNCIIGKNSMILVPTSVSGSVEVGEDCHIAADIIRNQVHIGALQFPANPGGPRTARYSRPSQSGHGLRSLRAVVWKLARTAILLRILSVIRYI